MSTKDRVSHKKIKNPGILFELLTRQLTTDIMSGKENSTAQKLIESYFKNNTALGKEYVLYQALLKYKYDADKAEDYLNEVIKAHEKINKSELSKSKYNLVKEIKNNYDSDSFFSPKIDDYKVLASIYKLFKSKYESVLPNDIIDSKYTIIEHITQKKQLPVTQPENEVLEEYKRQTKDLQMLTYKMMIDRFNDKYKNLNEPQKNLIKEYINNISSENSLYNYITEQIPGIKRQLSDFNSKVVDKAVTIKINEILKQINLIKECDELNDNHVVAMLNVLELIKELNIAVKGEK